MLLYIDVIAIAYMLDVYAMDIDEIQKVLNARDYPTVQSVRDALPRSLKGVIHGRDRDAAVKQVTDEIWRLRKVSTLTDIFK